MKFWDSSALMAVLAGEEGGRALGGLLEEDPSGMLWCLARVEVRSGLGRRVRAGAVGAAERDTIWGRFTDLRRSFLEVDALLPVRDQAERLLDAYALRAGDALQLGAAIVGAQGRRERLPIVTLDRRLAEAAAKEGFPVLPRLTGEGFVAERARGPRIRRRPRRVGALAAGR